MADGNKRQLGLEVGLLGLSDDELMRQIADGSSDAMVGLVRRHQQHIWSIAYYFTGHRHDADDVTQEVVLRIWQSAGKYHANGRFDFWLYRVVSNLCMDGHRRQRRGPQELNTLTGLSLACDPEPLPTETDEIAQQVQAAIQSLPDRQRLSLVLHRYKLLSHREIAEVTGWTDSAVESLLVRAYAQLRDSLRDLLDK